MEIFLCLSSCLADGASQLCCFLPVKVFAKEGVVFIFVFITCLIAQITSFNYGLVSGSNA